MKDYDHFVVWLDYFNKNLSRRKGRKIKRENAIFDPTINDLLEAAKASGFDPSAEETNEQARFPRRPYVKSGYILVLKSEGVSKSNIINTMAQKMVQKRNRQKSGQK